VPSVGGRKRTEFSDFGYRYAGRRRVFCLKKMRENQKNSDLPVIMHTNLFSEADKAEAMRLGAKEYVVKADITPTQLAEIVKKHVKAKKNEQVV